MLFHQSARNPLGHSLGWLKKIYAVQIFTTSNQKSTSHVALQNVSFAGIESLKRRNWRQRASRSVNIKGYTTNGQANHWKCP